MSQASRLKPLRGRRFAQPSALGPRILQTTRIDIEVLELAVQVGTLHPDRFRELAYAAAGDLELVLQVGALELFARFAQWQREVDPGDADRRGAGHRADAAAERR